MKAPSVVLPALPSHLTTPDRQAFDYFRTNVVGNLSGQFSSDVWQYFVLQLSYQQESTLHAAVAVGALYRAWINNSQSSHSLESVREFHQLALRQYGVAMAKLRMYIERSTGTRGHDITGTVLVTCLLFVCFEMLQGDQNSMLFHLVKSLKIMHEHCKPKSSVASNRRPVILHSITKSNADSMNDILVRLDSDSTMFGRRQPFLHPTTSNSSQEAAFIVPSTFTSIEEAKTYLDGLTSAAFEYRGQLLRIAERISSADDTLSDFTKHYCIVYSRARQIDLSPYPQIAVKKAELIKAFDDWIAAVDSMEMSVGDAKSARNLLLRIQCFYPFFIIRTFQDTSEGTCDLYQEEFDSVVELSAQYQRLIGHKPGEFVFKLEPEILGSLYLVGTKCRNPSTRRKAIELMQNATAQEGLWNGKLYAAFVERFMYIEEYKAQHLTGVGGRVTHIPEEARFSDVLFGLDRAVSTQGRLICTRWADETRQRLEIVEDKFPIIIDKSTCLSASVQYTTCFLESSPAEPCARGRIQL